MTMQSAIWQEKQTFTTSFTKRTRSGTRVLKLVSQVDVVWLRLHTGQNKGLVQRLTGSLGNIL